MTIKYDFNDGGEYSENNVSETSTSILSVAVFCGSREGIHPVDKLDAMYVGRALGLNGITQVYGGGDYAHMGHSSRACLEAGGLIKGYSLACFDTGKFYVQRLFETVSEDIHARKRDMLKEARAYFFLAGGTGTDDELLDVLGEQAIRLKAPSYAPEKPIIIINRRGLYDYVPKMIKAKIRSGYTDKELLKQITFVPDAKGAIAALEEKLERKFVLFDMPVYTPADERPRRQKTKPDNGMLTG